MPCPISPKTFIILAVVAFALIVSQFKLNKHSGHSDDRTIKSTLEKNHSWFWEIWDKYRPLFLEVIDDNRFHFKNLERVQEGMAPILKIVEARDFERMCDPSTIKKLNANIESLHKDGENIQQKGRKFFNADILSKAWVYNIFGNQYKIYIELKEKYTEEENKLKKALSTIDKDCPKVIP